MKRPEIQRIGYLNVGRFLGTTPNDIDAQIAKLVEEDAVSEMIIDLRYHGGGLISGARHLGGIIGGDAVEGQVAVQYKWNAKYANVMNSSELFISAANKLNLSRVYVLTSDFTNATAEILISSLEPFMDVIVVGSQTPGSQFTFVGQSYCGKNIEAMRSIAQNAAGFSASNGITPDCAVEDKWLTAQDSVDDPLINAALSLYADGICPTNVE